MTPRETSLALIADLAAPYGIGLPGVLGARITRRFAVVRQMTYAELSAARPSMSLSALGALFADRHHTTILHGIRQHQARMAWVEFLRLAADVEQPDLFARAA